MLFVFTFWILAFYTFFISGFAVIKLISFFDKNTDDISNYNLDEYFFIGFLIISLLTGILSLFIPIAYKLLILMGLIDTVFFIIFFKDITAKVKEILALEPVFSKRNIIILIGLILFLLTAVVHEISLSDTGLYHTQYIKWIRSYAVVPGLGNIHGRFAFNSMFFVITSLFTFEIQDTIIYPLNGLCFIILMIKLFSLFFNEVKTDNIWKTLLYALLILLSIHILLSGLNSPSPDTISAILIIYSILFVFNNFDKIEFSTTYIILLNLLVFSCVVFKLSSLFCILLVMPTWRKNITKGMLMSLFTGLLVISPFLIRNYYLSGYLIYPFPSIDIFNVDWKIPLDNVINEKAWIESWAKIPGKNPVDVLGLSFMQWIRPWLAGLTKTLKLIVAVNVFSILTLIVMFLKREYKLFYIVLVLVINLIFWFVNAQDPRFVFGFLIFGFSLNAAYYFKLIKYFEYVNILKYRKITIICLLLILAVNYWYYPVHTLRHSKLWFVPMPIEKANTVIKKSNFTYMVSLSDSKCFNSDIPCTPYPLKNVVLRGNDLSEGFLVINNCSDID